LAVGVASGLTGVVEGS